MKRDIQIKLERTLRDKLLALPDFAAEYILSLEHTKEIRTRIELTRDLLNFFEFLSSEKGLVHIKGVDLNILSSRDIRDYLGYLSEYTVDYLSTAGKEVRRTFSNSDSSKSRKLSTLREFFSYLYQEETLEKDVTARVEIKVNQRVRIKETLSMEELGELLATVREGRNISTEREEAFAKNHRERDYAICLLLAYTGIRASELLQLDLSDVSIKDASIIVIRKGGDQERIPLPTAILPEIERYLEVRGTQEKPLFLSSQNKRLSPKALALLLEKYGMRAGFDFKLKPHVLRRTFGTAHYNTFGDITLTGALLGHRSTETTRRFYAKVSEKRVEETMKKFDYPPED